jgi:FixJ family two-component response regulator
MRAPPVIAVIDNNRHARDALIALIASDGYLTETYATNEEFLAHAARSRATCLVVDAELGGLAGIEMSRRLAARGFTLPIIFLTAGDDPRLRKPPLRLPHLPTPPEAHWLLDFIADAVWRGERESAA